MATVFATRPAADWVDDLGPLGAAIGAVNRGSEVVRDPQVQARASVVEVDGRWVPASPIRVRDLNGPRSATATGAPPVVGSDTHAALQAVGYSEVEIDDLRAAGVIAN